MVRYYWGRPQDVVRWYLRGTLRSSSNCLIERVTLIEVSS